VVFAEISLRAVDQQKDEAEPDEDEAKRSQLGCIEEADCIFKKTRALNYGHYKHSANNNSGVGTSASEDHRHERVTGNRRGKLAWTDISKLEGMKVSSDTGDSPSDRKSFHTQG